MTDTDHITIDVPTTPTGVVIDGRPTVSAHVAFHDGVPTYRAGGSTGCGRRILELFNDGTGLAISRWHYKPGAPISEEAWLRYRIIEPIDDPDGNIAHHNRYYGAVQ